MAYGPWYDCGTARLLCPYDPFDRHPGPAGEAGRTRSVLAESVLIRHQLLILNRGHKRAPNLSPLDRMIAGVCTLFVRRARLLRSAILLKPSTLVHLHQILTK